MTRNALPTNRLRAIVFAVLLTPPGLGLLIYSGHQRQLYHRDFAFDPAEARRLAIYPRAMLAYGDEAWQNLALSQAADFYRLAAARDVLNMDVWLKLARTEAARGQANVARDILAFVVASAGRIARWQSPIALLAHELGMETTFRQSINFMLDRKLDVDTALTLLDAHRKDLETRLAVLDPSNQAAYLGWLMYWVRVSEARRVWALLAADQPLNEAVVINYIDFLVTHKYIEEARTIWQTHAAADTMTNGGFETPPSGRGFGWRVYPSPEKHWRWQHVPDEGVGRSAGLKLVFLGRANIDFRHVYQIVPLTPEVNYRLSYAWRGLNLSTDQGPFIDLEGYDCPDFHAHGPMLRGSSGWQEEHLEFTLPPTCRAIRLRVRRKISNRFDNKIQGSLWLDDFRIAPRPRSAADG
jgi:hypothetical protein